MMIEGWVKKDEAGEIIDRGAWVLLGYEETKGLGPGNPEDNPEGIALDLGKNVKAETFAIDNPVYAGAGNQINEIDTPDPEYPDEETYTGLILNDFGVEQYATAIARRPSLFVNPIIKSQSDAEDSDGDLKTLETNVVMEAGDVSAIMLYKEGRLRQGGPADIMMRRWVLPEDFETVVGHEFDPAFDNPFDFRFMVADVEDDEGLVTYTPEFGDDTGWDPDIVPAEDEFIAGTAYPRDWYPNGVLIDGALDLSSTIDEVHGDLGSDNITAASIVPSWHADLFPEIAVPLADGTLTYEDCATCHADSWAADENGDPVHGILDKVVFWNQDATNLYDKYWTNRYDLSKGHRGFLDGDFVMVMFGYAPNWLLASHGKEPINLFVRRSFDGGEHWTTTPAELDEGEAGTTYTQWQGVGDDVNEYTETYAEGDFEKMRNVSNIITSQGTIIDPRYSPTNMRRQTDILRRLTTEYTYEPLTGIFSMDTLSVDKGLEDARNDDLRDPSKFFAVYESGDTAPVASGLEAAAENLYYSRATNWGDDYEEVLWGPSQSGDTWYAWDWLENQADDKSGEAAIAASPSGQFMWAVWNQWKEEGEEHVYDTDAIFRRIYWLPDELRQYVTVEIVEEPVDVVEGEAVELTATASYTIGDESQPTDELTYAWDLDADGVFETEGQTVTTVATGALECVAVRAVAPSGTSDVDWGYINGAKETPRVWNVKLVDNIGLAGTREKPEGQLQEPGPARSRRRRRLRPQHRSGHRLGRRDHRSGSHRREERRPRARSASWSASTSTRPRASTR